MLVVRDNVNLIENDKTIKSNTNYKKNQEYFRGRDYNLNVLFENIKLYNTIINSPIGADNGS